MEIKETCLCTVQIACFNRVASTARSVRFEWLFGYVASRRVEVLNYIGHASESRPRRVLTSSPWMKASATRHLLFVCRDVFNRSGEAEYVLQCAT